MESDPDDPGAFIDAGSTFTVESVRSRTSARSAATVAWRARLQEQRHLPFPGYPEPSSGHTADELGDTDGSYVAGTIDRSRGLLSLSTVAYYQEKVEATSSSYHPDPPDAMDQWGCGDKKHGLEGIGLEGSFVDKPTGTVAVSVDCTYEGPAFGWDTQR